MGIVTMAEILFQGYWCLYGMLRISPIVGFQQEVIASNENIMAAIVMREESFLGGYLRMSRIMFDS